MALLVNFYPRLTEPRIPSACVFPHVLDQKQNKRRHFQATTDKQIPNMDVGCAVCRRVGQIIATPPAANHRFFVGQRGCTLVAGGRPHRKRHRHAKPPGSLHAQSRKLSIKTAYAAVVLSFVVGQSCFDNFGTNQTQKEATSQTDSGVERPMRCQHQCIVHKF